jgi:hypothetical protein
VTVAAKKKKKATKKLAAWDARRQHRHETPLPAAFARRANVTLRALQAADRKAQEVEARFEQLAIEIGLARARVLLRQQRRAG